jgi:hypothetical protein
LFEEVHSEVFYIRLVIWSSLLEAKYGYLDAEYGRLGA